jgi:hypothetical protein
VKNSCLNRKPRQAVRALSIGARVALLMVAATASACGFVGQPIDQSMHISCHALTTAEVATALAVKPESMAAPTPVGGSSDTCEFDTRPEAGPDAGSSVTLQITREDSRQIAMGVMDQYKKSRGGMRVDGVGQTAYQSHTCIELAVVQNSTFLVIRLTSTNVSPCSATEFDSLKMLGKKASSRV